MKFKLLASLLLLVAILVGYLLLGVDTKTVRPVGDTGGLYLK